MWTDPLREFGSRLANLFRRSSFEAEMNDELQFHIEMQTEQLVRSGNRIIGAKARSSKAKPHHGPNRRFPIPRATTRNGSTLVKEVQRPCRTSTTRDR